MVVDRFSKIAHFIPCSRSTSALYMAKLFFKEIIKFHGLPTTIVFDRDVKFVSYFWKTLWKLFWATLKYSFAFHPQTDVVNCFLGDLLIFIVGEKPITWDLMLPHAEFMCNNSLNRTIGKSPF